MLWKEFGEEEVINLKTIKVNVLGTEYTIVYGSEEEIQKRVAMKDSIGLFCANANIIYIIDTYTVKDFSILVDDSERRSQCDITNKATIRHELVHAFLFESGLYASSLTVSGAWALNEEMVDWIALNGEKLVKAWKEAEQIVSANY